MMTAATDQTDCSPRVEQAAMGHADATALAALLKPVADPLRLRMLSAIAAAPGGEACVCDLQALADVSQPTTSHHLKVLKHSGWLVSERRGTWVYYRIAASRQEAAALLLGGALGPIPETRES